MPNAIAQSLAVLNLVIDFCKVANWLNFPIVRYISDFCLIYTNHVCNKWIRVGGAISDPPLVHSILVQTKVKLCSSHKVYLVYTGMELV